MEIDEQIKKHLIKRGFYDSLLIFLKHGFKPVACTSYCCEQLFIFNTKDELDKALEYFKSLPRDNPDTIVLDGFLDCYDVFIEVWDKYTKTVYKNGTPPDIIWLYYNNILI
jgi:hypothetical protein